jgi:hypothetical protein
MMPVLYPREEGRMRPVTSRHAEGMGTPRNETAIYLTQ